jgi:MFS superfamily sulfate permease-like transporter
MLSKTLKADLSASLVVFLVALPLCLGIAIASNAPPISGLIAGVIGGIVIGALSKSNISVSGPAAGLTVIVITAQESLGTFENFLAAVVVAGAIQFMLGTLKAGVVGYYFPTAVIKGMLAAIGLILILKQIPHALGYDHTQMGLDSFFEANQQNTFTEIIDAFIYNSPGAILITILSLAILIFYDRPSIKNHKVFGLVPAALLAVISGILVNLLLGVVYPDWQLNGSHLVSIPIADSLSELSGLLTFPNFEMINSNTFWMTAVTIAVVGSIETLLSIEASDKLDRHKRITPTSRELQAQGIGNTISGLIGGLPITSVIVRSSANAGAGAETKRSAIFHGLLLLILALSIPSILNLIPLSCLSAVLFVVGAKLTKPAMYKSIYSKGWDQFLPFIITVIAILFTDLLKGISIGMVVGLIFVIKSNFHSAIKVTEHKGNYLVKLQKDVSFLNKALILRRLSRIPDGSGVVINAKRAQFIDDDIMEVLTDFVNTAGDKNITVQTEGLFEVEHAKI